MGSIIQEQFLNFQLKTALSLNEGLFNDVNIGEVGKENIYTNDDIKQSFIESVKNQDTFKPILNKVISLIETDRIIPAFVKVGLIRRIVRYYKKEKEQFSQSKNVLAKFDIDSRKIIILVENIHDVKYWKKEEALSLVMLHEFQHMTSILFPLSFMTIHHKSFVSYYKMFLKSFFGVKVSNSDSIKLFQWLHYKTETVKGRSEDTMIMGKQYLHTLWEILTPYFQDKKELEKKLIGYFKSLTLYLSNPELYHEFLNKKDPNVFFMSKCLFQSYKALNILSPDTLPIQEALYPSEVICVESEFNTQPRHLQLIEKIE